MPPRMPNTDWTKNGGLTRPRSAKWRERVEMADVVALDLEAGAVLGAGREDVFDVGEGVLEDALARALEIGLLPVVFEGLLAGEHRVEPEIHRAHVERGDLRLEGRGGTDALLDRHGRRAAGGDVDDAIGALLDHPEEGAGRPRATGPAGRRRDCAHGDARSPRPPRRRRSRRRRSPPPSPADAATSTACGSRR